MTTTTNQTQATQATKDLIQYVSAAVERGYKNLSPGARKQCDKLTARVERVARVAACITNDYGTNAAEIFAGTDVVKETVAMCCLIAELEPTPADYAALCKHVAAEAITNARQVAERETAQE